MEDILLVVNVQEPGESLIPFACKMAQAAKARLTGLFIENIYETTPVMTTSYAYDEQFPGEEKRVQVKTNEAIEAFKEACRNENITYTVLLDQSEPIQKVLYESIFTDLLILHPGTAFDEDEASLPSHFVHHILMKAKCPVLLAPQIFDDVKEIVFCYDGSASSIQAMKQFTYLFPGFGNTDAILLEVLKKPQKQHKEDQVRVMLWLQDHYENAHYHALVGEIKEQLFTYFFMKQKKIIVMGAYGKHLLKHMFRRSTAADLIQTIDLPLFNTHI